MLRDSYGVPNIYADNPEDLFLAQGYVHAQDRFYEMDFRRHLAAGRLSELFGKSQVETDAYVRRSVGGGWLSRSWRCSRPRPAATSTRTRQVSTRT